MGGGASRSPWATLEKTVHDDDKWKTFCDTFTITEKEQQEFWSLWARMDRKKTGEVNAETFRKNLVLATVVRGVGREQPRGHPALVPFAR